MPRSTKKGPTIYADLMKAIEREKASGKHQIRVKTMRRSATILPSMVDVIIEVHNGKLYVPVRVTSEMIGSKLGEFAPTRTFKGHAANKQTSR